MKKITDQELGQALYREMQAEKLKTVETRRARLAALAFVALVGIVACISVMLWMAGVFHK